MSGLSGNPSTSADGSYTGTVDYGWSGTVTPQKSGYTFSPSEAPTEYIIDSYSETNKDSFHNLNNVYYSYSQSFTGDGRPLDKCKFYVGKYGSPPGNVYAKLYAITGTFGVDSEPTGSPLATSDAVAASSFSVTGPPNWDCGLVTFTFSTPYTLVNGTHYHLALWYEGTAGSNFVIMAADGSSPSHAGNNAFYDVGVGSFAGSGSNVMDFIFYAISNEPLGSASIGSESYSNVTSNQTQNYTGTLQALSISGYVRTSGNVGISGVAMSGLPGNPSTSADGSYTATVDYGWSGTVTPTKSGYTFSPSSVPYTNVSSNQSQNYTGALQTLSISGYVRTSGGAGISGVVMSGLTGNPSTAADGSYTGSVNYGWSGTVTPTKAGYTFSPGSQSYSNVTSNQTQNYTGTLQALSISGYVRTSGGAGISGVVMSGLTGNPSTAADGSYTGSVNYGWSGTVTPTKAGYTFSPGSQGYSNVSSNQTQNYTGALQTLSISGYVRTSGGAGISGVVMSGLPGNPSTSADGSYTATVDYGWSGTVTPQKSGYTFSPSSVPYTNVSSNQTQNYTGTVQARSISGYVRTSGGAGISGVVMSGLTGNPSTAADGSYTATVDYSWSGTVTPTKSGYTFSPGSQSYSNVSSNQTQNYTGALQVLSISGYVRTSGGAGISGVVMSGLTGNPVPLLMGHTRQPWITAGQGL